MPKLPDFPRSLADTPVLPSSLRFGPESSLLAGAMGAGSSNDRPPPILDPLALHRKLLSQKMAPGALGAAAASAGGAGGLLAGAPAHSLYEMAALTHEMDTQAVTTKVKEVLLANNIGQKVGCKAFTSRQDKD